MKKRILAAFLCMVLLLSLAGTAFAAKLKYGDSGALVVALQNKLTLLNHYHDAIDGKYGYSTYLAVKAFQKAAGLKVDGVAGPLTLSQLAIAVPLPPPPASETLRLGDTGAKVTALQNRLIALAYLEGAASGTFDEMTLRAVMKFQKANGLPADGVAGGATKRRIESKTCFGKSIANWKAGFSVLRLQDGDAYPAVKTAQMKLNSLGYLDVTDGIYGWSTYLAVKKFQENNGLKKDGIIGPDTMNKLEDPAAKKKDETPPPAPPADPTYIRLAYGTTGPKVTELQGLLGGLGYYSGPKDGRYGYSTYLAVRSFQRINKLKVDGVVGKITWAKVHDPAALPKPAPKP